MRYTSRRRRHTSNWVYTIVAVCFLIVTLCIISLIPGGSDPAPDNADTTPAPDLLGDTGSLGNTPTPDGSASGQENSGILSADPHITITINKEKFAAILEAYQTNAATPSEQTLEEIQLQLQELTLAQEQLTVEKEEFRTRYETASDELASEKNTHLQKQKEAETENKRLKEELNKADAQLSEYDDKIKALEAEHKKLSSEEKELQQTEAQLQHLQEDITHAQEELTEERRELESGIQSIKENPNLSSESKETALIPLYAALEQLLMREAQLEHSEAEYKERSEALLAAKENLGLRLQDYQTKHDELTKLLAPYKQTQQELSSALKAAEAQLLSSTAELERIKSEASALAKEYQDKLTALETEEKRLTEEEQSLKREAATLQAPSSGILNDTDTPDASILAQRTLERILIILQEVPLSEDSNTASDILLTDVADIMITAPEPDSPPQDVSRTPPDSSAADSSDSHKHNN